MKKKEYIKPEATVEDIQLQSMLALSNVGMGSNERPGTDNDFNANDRRGVWGDIWAD